MHPHCPAMIFHVLHTVSGQGWCLGADGECNKVHFQTVYMTNSVHLAHFLKNKNTTMIRWKEVEEHNNKLFKNQLKIAVYSN